MHRTCIRLRGIGGSHGKTFEDDHRGEDVDKDKIYHIILFHFKLYYWICNKYNIMRFEWYLNANIWILKINNGKF